MSCNAGNPTFRLLDGLVGWDPANLKNLDGLGFDDETGLRLAQIEKYAVPAAAVLAALPPPRLAHGCGQCDWHLVNGSRLLRRDCCSPAWMPVWSEACDQQLLVNANSIAFRSRRIAVSDAAAKRVRIWDNEGDVLVAAIDCDRLVPFVECDRPNAAGRIARPGPLAFTPWDELLVADAESKSIWRFGLAGESLGRLMIALPESTRREAIDRLAVSDNCSIWVVTRTSGGSLKLWRASRCDTQFSRASIEELQKAFRPTGLVAADEEKGFCLEECGPDGLPITRCFTWDGEPIEDEIAPPPTPELHEKGQLLTEAIDSGIPRCRWHRVRIDADVPAGTMLSMAVATSESVVKLNDSAKSMDEGWTDFLAGVPHQLDWQIVEPGRTDFLIDQPPGRYLYLRLRLTGDKAKTPVVRSVRLDFPRVTSLDLMPPVYREPPEAEDFTERFLSLFDATIADLDRAIERSPALLDPTGVPDEVLPWLGSFLDVIFDPVWDPELRRKILKALPDLYRLRGTVAGLIETIKLIFGVEPVIVEQASERNWGSVGKAKQGDQLHAGRLGQVRLFGKSRARFRLNSSPLGSAPLRSYGNPDHDPLLAQVFRFRVFVPPRQLTKAGERERLERLVASQKPAHTIATIHVGGDGFILGATSAVGIDTVIAPPPPFVLGRNARLNRMSVVWHGKHGVRKGIQVGETSVVGVQTIL